MTGPIAPSGPVEDNPRQVVTLRQCVLDVLRTRDHSGGNPPTVEPYRMPPGEKLLTIAEVTTKRRYVRLRDPDVLIVVDLCPRGSGSGRCTVIPLEEAEDGEEIDEDILDGFYDDDIHDALLAYLAAEYGGSLGEHLDAGLLLFLRQSVDGSGIPNDTVTPPGSSWCRNGHHVGCDRCTLCGRPICNRESADGFWECRREAGHPGRCGNSHVDYPGCRDYLDEPATDPDDLPGP